MFAATAVLWIAVAFLCDLPVSMQLLAPLVDRCIALVTVPQFFFFRNLFFNFVTMLLQRDVGWAGKIVRAGLRFWPHDATAKQLGFLKVFAIAFRQLNDQEKAQLAPRLLALLADAVQSPAPRVADGALRFFTDRAIEPFLTVNLRLLFPDVHDAVTDASVSHWNLEIRDLARATTTTFSMLDRRLYHELTHQAEPGDGARAMLAWVQCLDAASHSWEDVPGKLAEIKRAFAGAIRKPQTRQQARMKRQQSVDPRRCRVRAALSSPMGPHRTSDTDHAPAGTSALGRLFEFD
jgi:hypothetical protein